MKKCMIVALLAGAVAGCAVPHRAPPDLERAGELWAGYNAVGKKGQRAFMRNLTADDLFAFTLAALPAYAREHSQGKEVDFADLRVEETLGMFGGDDFEDWGEKRLADGRRLTASTIIGLLEDPQLPPEWRAAFRGYLRIMFFANPGRQPSDAYEIGLTDQDIAELKSYVKRTSKGDPQQLH